MALAGAATLWPSAENYSRFKEVCADEIHDTHEAYVASAGAKLAELEKRGINFLRLSFDPDELAAFCRSNGSKVDAQGRASYAAYLAAQQHSKAAR